jgi:hypothetical protein
MKLILRGDLRCPQRGCNAAVVEYRDRHPGDYRADYRCKVHGSIRPTVKGQVGIPPRAGPPPAEASDRHRYPVPEPCAIPDPPPDDPPAPYSITAEGAPS